MSRNPGVFPRKFLVSKIQLTPNLLRTASYTVFHRSESLLEITLNSHLAISSLLILLGRMNPKRSNVFMEARSTLAENQDYLAGQTKVVQFRVIPVRTRP